MDAGLRSAGLDLVDGGPYPDPMRLQHCIDTIVVPHLSWYSEDLQIQMAEMAAR